MHDDVAAALTLRPTIELSKVYVRRGAHGGGIALSARKLSTSDQNFITITSWNAQSRCQTIALLALTVP